jgi:hypothetical protein
MEVVGLEYSKANLVKKASLRGQKYEDICRLLVISEWGLNTRRDVLEVDPSRTLLFSAALLMNSCEGYSTRLSNFEPGSGCP